MVNGTVDAVFNTVLIGGTGVVAATKSSYGYISTITSSAARLIENNIFQNDRAGSSGKHYAIRLANITNTTCNYNDLVSASGYIGNWNGTDKTTLADWKGAASGLDANSINVQPVYVGETTKLPNLHLFNVSPNNADLFGKGTVIASYTTDYDGDTRSATTPTMGADDNGVADVLATAEELSTFQTSINNAQALHDGAVEGTAPGQFESGSKATLQTAINTAQGVHDIANVTSLQVTTASQELDVAVTAFNDGKEGTQEELDQLSANIVAATSQYSGSASNEGTALGQYAASVRSDLNSAIATAQAVYAGQNSNSSQLVTANSNLTTAVNTFKNSMNVDIHYLADGTYTISVTNAGTDYYLSDPDPHTMPANATSFNADYEALRSDDGFKYQVFKLTWDAGTSRYKIEGQYRIDNPGTYAHAYVNEIGSFGGNVYNNAWSTMRISYDGTSFSVARGGSASAGFWKPTSYAVGATTTFQTGTLADNLVYTITPVAVGAVNISNLTTTNGNFFVAKAATLTIDVTKTVNNLTIAGGGKVTNAEGSTLTATAITIQTDATNGIGTYLDHGTTNYSGSPVVTVNQNLTGADANVDGIPDGPYWYLTSPVVGAKSSIFTPSATANRLWSYNEAGGTLASQVYTPITVGTETLLAGKGYVTRLTENSVIRFVGTALVNGSPSIDLTYTASSPKAGFNLIGNPYPSYLDVKTAIAGVAELEKGIWYRSFTGGIMGFDTYNTTTGDQVLHNGGTTVLTDFVPPMQAFWVKATAAKTIQLSNSWRSHQAGGNQLRSVGATAQKVRLSVSNGAQSDETLIGFHEGASEGFDNYDARKMFNGVANMPEIYSLAGSTEVAINGLSPLSDMAEIKLGFNTQLEGAFSINAKEILNLEEGQTVILKDKLLNVSQNLSVLPEYGFTSKATNSTDRFSIVIGKVQTSIESAHNPIFDVRAAENKSVEVTLAGLKGRMANVVLYNAMGQVIATKAAHSDVVAIGAGLLDGVYLVKVESNGFHATRKVILR